MSILQVTVRKVKCDFPGCEVVSPDFPRAMVARKQLKTVGWWRESGADYCPDHPRQSIQRVIRERLREAS